MKQVKEEKTRDQSVTRTSATVSCAYTPVIIRVVSCLLCKIMVPCHVSRECFMCHAEWPSPMLTFFSDIVFLLPRFLLGSRLLECTLKPKTTKLFRCLVFVVVRARCDWSSQKTLLKFVKSACRSLLAQYRPSVNQFSIDVFFSFDYATKFGDTLTIHLQHQLYSNMAYFTQNNVSHN